MKRYRSHKVVEAAPVMEVDKQKSTVMVATEKGTEIIDVPSDFFARGTPCVGDYLVCYQPDGYLSWSPKDKFEDGYREIGQYEKG